MIKMQLHATYLVIPFQQSGFNHKKRTRNDPNKIHFEPLCGLLGGSCQFALSLVFSTFNFNLSKPLSAWVYSFNVPITTRSIMATQSWILRDSSPMLPYICIHIQTCWKKNINLGLNFFLDFFKLNSFSNYVEPNAYFDSMSNMHRSW